MNAQLTMLGVTEPDYKKPIPKSWKVKTPRCGLKDTKKCPSYAPECSHKCQGRG